jgi:hypothetical protein
MWTWLKGVFARPAPWRGAVLELEDRLEALERRDRQRQDQLRQVEGSLALLKRQVKGVQEPPGDAISPPEDTQVPLIPRGRPTPSTAHLAGRFRVGG